MFANPLTIKLSEQSSESDKGRIQILRMATFDHNWYGKMEFSKPVFEEMIKNFNKDVRGIELAVNYSHDSCGKAAGWIESLEIDGDGLFADVRWTKTAREIIDNEEFKYISAEFDTDYKDPESGAHFGHVLLGAALTNIPFVKKMEKVFDEKLTTEPQNKKDNKKMNFEEILKETVTLSDNQKRDLAEKLGYGHVKQEGQSETEKALSEENKTLKAKIDLQEKEMKFSALLSEGKVVPAQKEAFINGDMAKFAELSVKVNFSEHGTGENPEGDQEPEAKTKEEAEEKVSTLAEKMAKDEKITFSEAVKRVLKANKKLADIYNA